MRSSNLPSSFQPVPQIGCCHSISRTQVSFQACFDSSKPSRDVGCNLRVDFFLEAIGNLVCPIRVRAVLIYCFNSLDMSVISSSRSWIQFEEFNDALRLKDPRISWSVFTCVMIILHSQTNSVKKRNVTFNSIKDVSSTNEAVDICRNWLRMIQESVQISDCEFWITINQLGLIVLSCTISSHEVPIVSTDQRSYHE